MIIPNSDSARKRVKDAAQKVSEAMSRIEEHQDHIKEICAMVEDELDVPKAKFKKVATMFHKGNADIFASDNAEIEDLYDATIGA